MSGRALVKPEVTTPVIAVEEQAKIETAAATPDVDQAKAIAEAEAAEVAKVSVAAAADKAASAVEVVGTEAGKTGTPRKGKPRIEKFEATKPNGTVVIVERNIDTGEQTVTEK